MCFPKFYLFINFFFGGGNQTWWDFKIYIFKQKKYTVKMQPIEKYTKKKKFSSQNVWVSPLHYQIMLYIINYIVYVSLETFKNTNYIIA